MSDQTIRDQINALVAEEHSLRGNGDAQRLREVEAELDQCWDLLRQRQARAEFGENPDDAKARSVSEVEGYLQ
ncbi:MAG TPA: DUF2630 family protein [Marmoricola sp.]|nr:DUF2630 family protein [Marmoricola sp.]